MAVKKKLIKPRNRAHQEEVLRAKGYVPITLIREKIGNDITTLYRWMDTGEIKGLMVGGRRYVTLSSVVRKVTPEVAEMFGLITAEEAKAYAKAAKG